MWSKKLTVREKGIINAERFLNEQKADLAKLKATTEFMSIAGTPMPADYKEKAIVSSLEGIARTEARIRGLEAAEKERIARRLARA